MTSLTEIEDLANLLNSLQKEDKAFRVFGANRHQYKLNSPLTETELQAFEQKYQVKLPVDYRLFLKNIGNGGAGPFYGLETLEESARGCKLNTPFPFTKATELYSEKEMEAWNNWWDDYSGVLEICHQGCATYSYLVVNGPTYATIWEGREDLYPTGLTFYAWYRHWAERSLRTLANESLIDRIKIGMAKSEVIKVVGGDWQERQALYSPITFLEAPDIAAQLELNAEKVVIKINRWSFI
jgi:hypothetical protein